MIVLKIFLLIFHSALTTSISISFFLICEYIIYYIIPKPAHNLSKRSIFYSIFQIAFRCFLPCFLFENQNYTFVVIDRFYFVILFILKLFPLSHSIYFMSVDLFYIMLCIVFPIKSFYFQCFFSVVSSPFYFTKFHFHKFRIEFTIKTQIACIQTIIHIIVLSCFYQKFKTTAIILIT